MYNTGIFTKFCQWEWDLSTGKWDFEKKWARKWDWYPPSGPSCLMQVKTREMDTTLSNVTDHKCGIGISSIFDTVFRYLPIFLTVSRYCRLQVVPHLSSGIAACAQSERNASARGVIFLRARVSLALLSLRTNGGLLVVRRYWVLPIVPLFSGCVSNIWSNVTVPTTQTHLLRLNFMVKFKLNFAKKN